MQRKYIGEDYRKVDPVPQLTFKHGPILCWTKALRWAGADKRARRYVEIMEELAVVNWASFALYGPKNRDGFAAIRFSENPEAFVRGRLGEYHSLLLTAHLQICKIIDEDRPSFALSDREREVLEWMGHGKSSGDIAAILSISPETVRTYTRRIYHKLEASDRVTATVRALKLGLIDL